MGAVFSTVGRYDFQRQFQATLDADEYYDNPDPAVASNPMDLSDLPAELIVNILGRMNFSEVQKIRKMNGRIDQIVQRNKLFRIPIDSLEISEDKIWGIFAKSKKISPLVKVKLSLPTNYKLGNLPKTKCKQMRFDALGYYFHLTAEKMRSVNHICLEEMEIEEILLNSLFANKKLFRSSTIKFEKCSFKLPLEKFFILLNDVQLFKVEISECKFLGGEEELNDEVLSTYNLSTELALTNMHLPKITIESFRNRGEKLQLSKTRTGIKLNDVLQFAKDCHEGVFFYFGTIPRENLTLLEIEGHLRREGFQFYRDMATSESQYHVSLKMKSDRWINFIMQIIN